ncbi:class I SAM-dependent DNA methyltransferase [Hydrogenimonas sp.]
MGLELYAKIEPMLGFDEEVEALYDYYRRLLKPLVPASLIDIGCGNGRFLKSLEKSGIGRLFGIDLSREMVARARALGVEAEATDLCEVTERFEAATAVFDVLNYIPPQDVPSFLGCVAEVLEPGGHFVADINTLYGFEGVAPGSLVRRQEGRFLALEADFDGKKLVTRIDYFEAADGGCYRKESDTVEQFWHDPAFLARACEELELLESHALTMYGEEPDKELLLFRRR